MSKKYTIFIKEFDPSWYHVAKDGNDLVAWSLFDKDGVSPPIEEMWPVVNNRNRMHGREELLIPLYYEALAEDILKTIADEV